MRCRCGRYCRLLIQEFAVKVDQGFLMAVLALFSSGEASDEQKMAEFRRDCAAVDQSLVEDTMQLVTTGVRNFYDQLHCSPIKVTRCVSINQSVVHSAVIRQQVMSQRHQRNILRSAKCEQMCL